MIRIITFCLAFFCLLGKPAAQCQLQWMDCPVFPDVQCDLSPNDAQLWNDISWWDNTNQLHDLAEVETDLQLSFRDTCPGAVTTIRCVLLLDLDGDGVQETRVDTDNPPAAGVVSYGNVASTGTDRTFDQRPVPANQKWRFVLETVHQGDTTTARLRWSTEAAPGVYALPALTHGFHKIRWELRDAGGLISSCTYDVQAKDCQAPIVTCLQGISVNILPTQQIQLWASDFLVYTEDNVTPTPLIRTGIRAAGTGTGFPVDPSGNPIPSIVYDCGDLGTQMVELWSIDQAGNADYCLVNVLVKDENNHCTGPGAGFAQGCASLTCTFDGLEGVTFKLQYSDHGQNLEEFYNVDGCGPLGSTSIPFGTDVTITPSTNQSGLATQFDMLILSKHLSGVDPFDTPYQWIAADANRDGVLNNLDLEACTKHILGIELIDPIWRFVDKNALTNLPDNPLTVPLPGSVTVNTSNLPAGSIEFVGIQLCNLSCGNVVGFFELDPQNQHLIGTPQPNPTSGGVSLPLQLVQAETVTLMLTDGAGRLIFQQILDLPAGAAMFEIPATAMPEAGMYFWRLQAGAVMKSGKVTRM